MQRRGYGMAQAISPLRYPGGKGCLLKLTADILERNNIDRGHYAEPFAGGCGLALALLYGGYVSEIHINDLDPAVHAFWYSVLFETEEFILLIEKSNLTIDEWHKQRNIHRAQNASDPLALGFSTFYLNRTNRSGIIKGGGVIGGFDQTGNYKMDCRFNKEDLVRRIRRMRRYQDRIHLSNLDAIPFIRQCNSLPDRSMLFIDPPYYKKGPGLYTSFYKPGDHAILAATVLEASVPWVVTYDDTPEIRYIYRMRRQFSFDVNYTLQEKRVGTELLIASKGLRLPSETRDRRVNGPIARAA